MLKPSSLRSRIDLLIGVLILTAIAPLKSEPEPVWVPKLEDSQVFITYGELKRLTDQAAIAQRPSPPPPVPVVPACLTQVRYQLKFEKTTPQLIATFTAENLSSGWASLPLGSFHSAAQDPVQPSTRLARLDDQVLLILEKPGRAELTLSLAPSADGAFEIHLPAQSALNSLEWAAPPPEYAVQLTQADGTSTRHDQASIVSLRPDKSPWRLDIVKRNETPSQGLAHNSAIITEALFQTQMAQDGAQLTSVTVRLEHSTATILPLILPDGAEMLRCAVFGKPVSSQSSSAGIHLTLPAPSNHGDPDNSTEVTFTYFLRGAALHDAEGEIDLALPRSPLLIRRLDWTIELPEGLQLTASGNLEHQASPAPKSHVLQLSRRLCRDDVTQTRITYRHPNLNVR
jgi:hypothetical protein